MIRPDRQGFRKAAAAVIALGTPVQARDLDPLATEHGYGPDDAGSAVDAFLKDGFEACKYAKIHAGGFIFWSEAS